MGVCVGSDINKPSIVFAFLDSNLNLSPWVLASSILSKLNCLESITVNFSSRVPHIERCLIIFSSLSLSILLNSLDNVSVTLVAPPVKPTKFRISSPVISASTLVASKGLNVLNASVTLLDSKSKGSNPSRSLNSFVVNADNKAVSLNESLTGSSFLISNVPLTSFKSAQLFTKSSITPCCFVT